MFDIYNQPCFEYIVFGFLNQTTHQSFNLVWTTIVRYTNSYRFARCNTKSKSPSFNKLNL